jgi:transcriptional regulator with XRE-family HTH domain
VILALVDLERPLQRVFKAQHAELGKAVGVSQRVIAYYETESEQPPGALLVDLAKALKVSADELLGVKPAKEKATPKRARLLKRLQRVEQLPPPISAPCSSSSTHSSRPEGDSSARRHGHACPVPPPSRPLGLPPPPSITRTPTRSATRSCFKPGPGFAGIR